MQAHADLRRPPYSPPPLIVDAECMPRDMDRNLLIDEHDTSQVGRPSPTPKVLTIRGGRL
eukprot:5541004-Pyramimonas_sp.AAC.1